MKIKKSVAIFLALSMAFSLSMTTIAAGAEDTIPAEISVELPTDAELLSIVQDNIDAYEEQYILHSVTVINKFVSEIRDDSYDVDFMVDLEVELKYSSAAQLPHVQGIAETLGINTTTLTTEQLVAELNEGASDVAIATMAQEEIMYKASGNAIPSDDAAFQNTVVDVATNELTSLVTELEELYIGQTSSMVLSFRATFTVEGEAISVSAVAYDGSAYDVQLLTPETNEEMRENGVDQLYDIVNTAVVMAKEPQLATLAAEKPVYHRVTARDYANTWTSTQPSGERDTSKWKIASNPNAYPPLYPANDSDCANYVSQAICAGGIPETSSSVNDKYHWFASQYGCSIAWESCENMHFYFTENDYWTASNFANCNAGGVIFLKDSSGDRYHVVMCVHNDTVTRKYSAHTTDKKEEVYTGVASFGSDCDSLEYWVFTNSSAD